MKMFYVDKVCKAFGVALILVRMVTGPRHTRAPEGHLVTYPPKGPVR